VILDPFSGTATTGLVAAEEGLSAQLFDINPFLVWFGNAKITLRKN
jgi:DNA modification methylase